MTLLPRYAGIVCLIAAVALVLEAVLIDRKIVFLLAGAVTGIAALAGVYAMGRRAGDVRLPITLLYAAGVIGAVAGYCYLALVTSGAIGVDDEVVDWGLLDKRPFVFGYLAVGAFIVFHWLVVRLAEGAPPTGAVLPSASWPLRIAGGLLIAVMAFCWLGVPALRGVSVVSDTALAKFFDIHSHVHLSALEQIRLGATPYLEAQTQYGPGNQVLMSYITDLVHFSNHGFSAANILLNVVCIVLFFVVLQQFLGFGWAAAALLGWVLWPSPSIRIDFAGWTVLTRWLAIPVLAMGLAWLLVAARPTARGWLGPLLAGAVWGVGGFLSQENFTGGLLVFGFSLALFGPVSGLSPRALIGFTGAFVGVGLVVFVGLVGSFVGFPHFFDVLALANAKSSLVMAGISNSIWSDNLGLSIGFKILHGRLYTAFEAYGELRELVEAYGAAILLLLGLAALAGFLVRRWTIAGEKGRTLAWKFGAVAIGAFVLHIFTLMRTDTSHLAAPSFLLPLFLLMLPLFAWRCVGHGRFRNLLLILSLAVVTEAAITGSADVVIKVRELGDVGKDTAQALETYREFRSHRGERSDLAARYSPIVKYQRAFREHPDFDEARELFDLLHERLDGRRLELGFYKFDDLVAHPDSFYFLGGFRALSGITSPKNSIWLRSERDAWIRKVASMPSGCVFFEPDPEGQLFDAWMRSGAAGSITLQPIVGRRAYGMLACKS